MLIPKKNQVFKKYKSIKQKREIKMEKEKLTEELTEKVSGGYIPGSYW